MKNSEQTSEFPKDRPGIFILMAVILIPLSVWRMNNIGGWHAYSTDLLHRRIFIIGWGCLTVCSVTLATLMMVKQLNPSRANVAFVYGFAALVTIALVVMHVCLELQFPRRQESFRVPWEYTGVLVLGGIHTVVAACTAGVAIVNARRIRCLVNASPSESSNNVVLWVGLFASIIVIYAIYKVLGWIDLHHLRRYR